jgi:HEAT repeat protein
MNRVGRLLNVLPGEGRLAARLLALMVCVWAGFAIGANGIEGLLFARVGPDTLPYLYVALGIAATAVMLALNVVLTRPRSQRLLLVALLAAAVVVMAMRGLLVLGQDWVYLVTWLVMMVLWTGGIVVTWGIAGAVHDTRQAKRLFPLYASGVILGAALGGLATAPLARWVGAENLLLIWAATLAAGFLIGRQALAAAGVSPRRLRRPTIAVRARMAEGLQAVRSSPLLMLLAVLIALLTVPYFSLSLLFAKGATARFPDADALAGFLGLFMGATSATALLASLLGARRLGARFGVAPIILALPLIYLGGFAALLVSLAFLPLVAFRFLQMVWLDGVWEGAWQGLYNVVPPDRREAARAFVDGVALQAGVVLAGLILILADRVRQPWVVAVFGLVFAGLAVAGALRLRRAYPEAVLAALRAGNPDVFLIEQEPFGGIRCDAAALSVAVRAASDPDAAVRRMAVEILGEVGDPDVRAVLERALADVDPVVRAAALRGLARVAPLSVAGGPELATLTALLHDDHATVRLAALELWPATTGADDEVALRPLLVDPDARVRARAAARLLHSRRREEARETLLAMAESTKADWRAEAIRAFGSADGGLAIAAAALDDPEPLVRRAAVSVLAARDGDTAPGVLVGALGDPDPGIRADAVEALVQTGPASIPPLRAATARTELEAGAMQALVRLHALEPTVVNGYVRRKVTLAVRYAGLMAALGDDEDPRVQLVAHALQHASRRRAEEALLAASPAWPEQAVEAVDVVLENLEARDPAQRANALEMLEAVGEPEVVRPLMEVWEGHRQGSKESIAVLSELMRDPDPWLRACAAHAAPAEPQLRSAVEDVASSDPNPFVRAAAREALRREERVETLSSLSLMERMVFLRRVALFQDLSPDDLKHVAEISTEHAFSDGAVIAEEGDPGDELHVVVSGEIRVLVGRDGGSLVEVARRGPGEYLGEMAIISRAPRMASLTARGDVRTLTIDRRRFERILRERAEASLAVMRVLCDRLREVQGAEPPETWC